MNEFIWHADATSDTPRSLRPNLQCPACGRNFVQSNAYSTHARSCRPQKKRVASALDSAKEKYERKKARLMEPPAAQIIPPESNQVKAMVPANEVRDKRFLCAPVLSVVTLLRLILLPLPLPNSWMTIAPFHLRRDGRVERIVDFRCVTKTNSRHHCAVYPLRS